ncbi:TPA: hypothetical protein DEX28_01220 [Patescibacteria group bacterium]|nr:MAG: polymerase protein [Parcubacteria group bacterium GW2011_GWA1_Parcubacteria_45_10]KKT88010.1 MAG: polymerase protein [Parcubacteria group bacterium GW2011_GWB1_45_10]HCI05346.1 hypothetical protein [Patescibacteria group bacterium]
MKIVVIDTFGLIHRAYHAMPGFMTKSGEASGAIYGFCSMFLKIISDFSPDGVVACFDLRGKTFRNELYSDYQAQREDKGEDFYSQVGRVKQFLEILGVKMISFPEHDGDDAVGSVVSSLLKDKKSEIVILSGDNDLLQLVGDRVRMFSLKKGITDTVIYDEKAVVEKYGFVPALLPDFKALAGDASDNIPGVLGIGPKTATNLILEYGSLEKIFAARQKGKLNEKISEKLKEEEKNAFLFKDLATIRRNLLVKDKDFSFQREKLHSRELADFFEELGFRSLLKRVGFESKTEALEKSALPKLKELSSEKFFKKSGSFSEIFLVQKDLEIFFVSDGVFKTTVSLAELKSYFKDILPDEKVVKIVFDFKSLLHGLELFSNRLFEKQNPEFFEVFDLKILGWLADSELSDYRVEKLVKRFLKQEFDAENLIEQFIGLFRKLDAVQEIKKIYREIEMPLIQVLFQMEKNGVLIDEKFLGEFRKEVEKKLGKIEQRIFELAGEKLNLNSPKELSAVIYQKLKLPSKKSRKLKSGYFSTDSETLEKIESQHEIVSDVLEWRELAKLLNTYVKTLPEFINQKTKRLHTTFLQTGTATGRLASEAPNLQNIPKHVALANDLRKAFLSENGFSLVSFDYSQIELRLAASLSKDKNMIKAFLSGQDIHRLTASLIWNKPLNEVTSEQRFQAKALNFGVLYGMGVRSLAQTAKVSQDEARIFIDDYFHNFPGLKNYIDKTLGFLRENGYVETVFGRRRYLQGIYSGRPQLVAQAERMALNLTLQGLAADIIKKAMIKIAGEILPEYQGKARMILQIHDELLFEIKDEIINQILPEIKSVMEGVFQDTVPVLVESHVGKTWAEVD